MTETELIERKKVLWRIYDRLENEIAFYSVQRDKEERTMWKAMYTKQIEAIRSEADTIKYALDLVEEKLDGVRWQNDTCTEIETQKTTKNATMSKVS